MHFVQCERKNFVYAMYANYVPFHIPNTKLSMEKCLHIAHLIYFYNLFTGIGNCTSYIKFLIFVRSVY